MSAHEPAVPEPSVSPDAYDEAYYRGTCAGYERWSASEGREVDPIYGGVLTLADLRPGEVVVDVGTGRGELVAVAVERGAGRAIGVDYSPTAVELASQTLQARGVADRAEVRRADARRLPVDDASADLVTMVDVVEHLTPPELDRTLAEVGRVLRPGGRLFVHTMPNRLVYDVTYRLHRAVARLGGARWPADPRNDDERRMHVNEQTRGGLARTLRTAGFDPVHVEHGRWVHDAFVPEGRHRRLYGWLAAHRLTRPLGAADLFATAHRPGAPS